MNREIILSMGMLLLICSSVSAISADFYYSKTCPYCQKVYPLIQELSEKYHINFIDVAEGSYELSGVPFLIIKTNDDRKIELIGSQEIPNYSLCEMQEMSTMRCPTYSSSQGFNSETNSWFIR